MSSIRYVCQSLIKLIFSGQFSEKDSNVIFQENPSSGSQVVLWGRTDRRR